MIPLANGLYQPTTFYLKQNLPYAWIQIPKNASIFGENIFSKKLGFTSSRVCKGKILIVFLRNPIDRWISGIGQYFYSSHSGNFLDHEIFYDLIFDQLIFDVHTCPQSYFLKNLNVLSLIKFNMDNTEEFHNDLKSFIKNQFDQDIELTPENQSHSIPKKQLIKDLIKKQIETNDRYRYKLLNLVEPEFQFLKELKINSINYLK